ncbi:hypothetical protein [Nocardia flavorosea]|uniref:Uncharacterized protein n=1 Tax=Nocardia flavorosea TaxID=53429 RepID=A0A846YJ27_9NOCA|nr:hypothetical protein [Nocardia flavorosea]NKY57821.1 hypothetical protein [Nocardia flavorosea]
MDSPNVATLKAITVSRIYLLHRRLITRGYTMIDPDKPRRAVALLHSEHDPAAYEELMRRHRLNVAYTVHTDAPAVLAALIAVQHALEHLADVVVIPHLGVLEASTPWWVVTEAADLITGTQEYPLWSAVTAQTRRRQ